jgi:beta-galactosidase
MRKYRSFILVFLFLAVPLSTIPKERDTEAAVEQNSRETSSIIPFPFIGAQVFIEPGQTGEEIDRWLQVLKENNFQVCRIRLFESYMRKGDGSWDFTLFDQAFRSAEKYGIKVFATLFPYTEKSDIGGFKFPSNEEHLRSIALFIRQVTTHFTQFKSLYAWVLINEPGVGGRIPATDFTKRKFEEWKRIHPQMENTDQGYPVLVDASEQAFLLDYNTWYLKWLADEIRKYDPVHELHVNNHALFQNCAEYDFPEWRNFLGSLGGSAHASWHFGYFTRQHYALAMSANSEMIRSGAGSIPWLMTEIQGGNNIYSGRTPMCPTREEIAQWLWIIIATDGKGSIFWTLNPRSSGIESGEWALLDFQNNPSDRMLEAAGIAETLNNNRSLFENSRLAESNINVIYIRQSLWAESKITEGSTQNFEARKVGGIMKSSLAYFEALSGMGLNVNMKEFGEFNFEKPDFTGTTIILSNQIAMPGSYATILEDFVRKGGKLIVDGLTGYFDEHFLCTMKTGFPFENLFGGNVREFKLVDNLFNVEIGGNTIPAHLWLGYVLAGSGKVAATQDGEAIALRNQLGNGEVIWIPSLIGLGSRLEGDYSSLTGFLNVELARSMEIVPVKFKRAQKDILMKTMISGESIITVVINKGEKTGRVKLDFSTGTDHPRILYSNKQGKIRGDRLRIEPEETMVIRWERTSPAG